MSLEVETAGQPAEYTGDGDEGEEEVGERGYSAHAFARATSDVEAEREECEDPGDRGEGFVGTEGY